MQGRLFSRLRASHVTSVGGSLPSLVSSSRHVLPATTVITTTTTTIINSSNSIIAAPLSSRCAPIMVTAITPIANAANVRSMTTKASGATATTTTTASVVAPSVVPFDHIAAGEFNKTDCGLWVDRSLPPTFSKILIANRGEIACRVIRTARQLGIKTVAVYSDADAKAMHVQMADEAYRIGESPATQSYLIAEKILEVAKRSGAQAIHPGYGFLSENAAFANACDRAGVVFIGPPSKAILAMGSKSASKHIMTAAGVPVVPGYHGDAQDVATLRREALKCGYPIMLKAVSGGGGKGMRIVRSDAEFEEALDGCKREALSSFKDDRVLLERYIERPRHIEFQVFADQQGNAVHFYERDCSVQRRHQKVLEEAPAPGMSAELRAQMGKSATDAAKAVGYVGAGTVEFIFDAATDEYFFMEMNTRLQVEHPVTEMIMRRDLVQWQLHVAAGNALPEQQSNIFAKGHAIEARVYAENPDNNFLPMTGRLTHLRAPANAHDVRVETGVRQGDEVSIFYDPMIAKLVVWGLDRSAALKRMSTALREYQIIGPPTNLAFLQRAVAHPAFAKGRVETGFIPQNIATLIPKSVATPNHVASLAVLSLLQSQMNESRRSAAASLDFSSPWHTPNGIRLGQAVTWRPVTIIRTFAPSIHEEAKQVAIKIDVAYIADGIFDFKYDDGTIARVRSLTSNEVDVSAIIGENAYKATVVRDNSEVHVFIAGDKFQFALPEVVFGGSERGGDGAIAPMAGKVVKVSARVGQTVKRGDALVIMEAMKMEHIIRASADGVVERMIYQVGDFVDGGKVMVTFVKPT